MRLVALGLLGCATAQTVLFPTVGLGGLRPDLFLLLVLLLSPRLSPEGAAAQGFGIGLVQDALSGGPMGLCAFVLSLMGFLTARLSRDLVTDKPLAQFWLLLAGAVTADVLTYILLAFFLEPPPLLISLRVILPEVLLTACLGFCILRMPPVRVALARAT
jgi:rod shape-determining protein MreD